MKTTLEQQYSAIILAKNSLRADINEVRASKNYPTEYLDMLCSNFDALLDAAETIKKMQHLIEFVQAE